MFTNSLFQAMKATMQPILKGEIQDDQLSEQKLPKHILKLEKYLWPYTLSTENGKFSENLTDLDSIAVNVYRSKWKKKEK